MELILIDSSKLKIILTKNDLDTLNINVEDMDYSNTASKRVFWELIEKAKTETGFNADKSKLYVQLFPSIDGGCEMFITKYLSEPSNNLQSSHQKKYRLKAKSNTDSGFFLTLNFEILCNLCKRLAQERPNLYTSLYYDGIGTYIFIIKNKAGFPSYQSDFSNKDSIPEYLCEYGNLKPVSEMDLLRFEEHYKKIATGNAANIIFSILKN